jgi:hypothetical protein
MVIIMMPEMEEEKGDKTISLQDSNKFIKLNQSK